MKYPIFIIIAVLFSNYAASQTIITYTKENSELPDNYITSVYVDENDNKWIGTNEGLVFFDNVNWTIYTSTDVFVTDDAVNDLNISSNNALWIGTNDGATKASYDGSGVVSTTIYTNENSDITANKVTCISEDGTGSIWFGGLDIISSFLNDIWNSIDDNIYFDLYDITTIASTNDTTNFVGTKGGGVFLMFNDEVDGITGGTRYQLPWSQLPSDSINTIFVDDTIQWYGSNYGVSKHLGLKAKENWLTFTKEQGLVSNKIKTITKDGDGNIWFGTDSGISIYNGDTIQTFLTVEDGLSSNTINDIAFQSNGNVWIATDNGLTKIEYVQDVGISNIYANDQKISAFPNPSSTSIHIKFSLPSKNHTDISIFDASGKLVKTINSSYLSAGTKEFIWDLTNNNKAKAPPGIYTVRIISENFIQSKKLLVL